MKIVENQPSNPESIRSQFLHERQRGLGRSRAGARLSTSWSRTRSGLISRRRFPTACLCLPWAATAGASCFRTPMSTCCCWSSKEIQGDAQREALSAFLRSLWDSGLRLSQSVRTIAECCQFDQNNVELSISLIDQRFLIGDQRPVRTARGPAAEVLPDEPQQLDPAPDQADQSAPREVSRHHLSPGAEHQGNPGRHARSACRSLAVPAPRCERRRRLSAICERRASFFRWFAASCTTKRAATRTF